MLVLSEQDVRQAVSMDDAIRAVEEAFASAADGLAQVPFPIYQEFAESNGEIHVKGAHITGGPHFSFKMASGFFDNPAKGLPVGGGLVVVFDAATGQPEALIMDNGYLTDLRTGAAGAVAARHLASGINQVALVGAGLEARFQLRALRCLGSLPKIKVWSRTQERMESFRSDMAEELDADVELSSSVEEAVSGADLVITATPSREPLLHADMIGRGTHITALGSDSPDKRELSGALLARADVLVVDSLQQCLAKGELHHAFDEGAITEESVTGELGDVITGRVKGRTSPDQVSICDLTGVGIQDLAVASSTLKAAHRLALGEQLRL